MSQKNPSGQRRQSAHRKNTKLTGERSEAAFLARCIQLGFGIAKPWGDSRRYDFILDNGECLHRVQVKCTESIRARAYETRATYTTGKGRAVYTKQDIDFIAAHVVPLDLWYILPVEVCTPAPMLRFYPQRKARIMRLEPYREAWSLVLPKASNHVMDLHACREENPDQMLLDQMPLDHMPLEDTPSAFEDIPSAIVILSEAKDPYTASSMGHAGTSSLRCSPSAARRNKACGAGALARDPLNLYRELCRITPIMDVPKSLALWSIPRLKLLVPRKGKHVFPSPQKG